MVTAKEVKRLKIGERIRAARLRQGLSVPEAAARVEMNRSYWYQVEHGKPQPGSQQLSRFAAALGCTVAELAGEDATPLTPAQKRWLGLLDLLPASRVPDAYAQVARLAAEDMEIADPLDGMMVPA